jgi:hypothetical protein
MVAGGLSLGRRRYLMANPMSSAVISDAKKILSSSVAGLAGPLPAPRRRLPPEKAAGQVHG